MDLERTLRRRKPLSDCTNTPVTRITVPLSSSSIRPKRKPSGNPKRADDSSSKWETSIGSNDEDVQHSLATPSRKISNVSDNVELGDSEFCTVYTRRNLGEKKKRAEITLTCPPMGRMRAIWDKPENESGSAGPSRMRSVSPQRNRKKHRLSTPEPADNYGWSQDFVEQQKKYFAEIDAFELQEEVVSENDKSE